MQKKKPTEPPKKSNRGGFRFGAGRPAKKDFEKKHTYSFGFSLDTIEYLRSLETPSQDIESLIRRTKGFREWKKSQPE